MTNFSCRPKSAMVGLLISVLLLSGCGDLLGIRKFSETAAIVGQNFPALSSDIYESCVRKYRYQFYRNVAFVPDKMVAVDDLQAASKLEGLITNAPPAAVQAESSCRRFRDIQPSIVLLNKALVGYMKTLGDLAADDLTSYDKELDGLSGVVSGAGFFSDAEVKAGKGLGKLILDATTNFYRRKKLKTAIETSNGNVLALTYAMKTFVQNNYVLALKDELRQMDSYYKANILEHQTRVGSPDPLTVAASKTRWDQERQLLQDRMRAAEAYVKILENVASGHSELYNNRNNLNGKEVAQIALQYGRAIEELVGDFRKAF